MSKNVPEAALSNIPFQPFQQYEMLLILESPVIEKMKFTSIKRH